MLLYHHYKDKSLTLYADERKLNIRIKKKRKLIYIFHHAHEALWLTFYYYCDKTGTAIHQTSEQLPHQKTTKYQFG